MLWVNLKVRMRRLFPKTACLLFFLLLGCAKLSVEDCKNNLDDDGDGDLDCQDDECRGQGPCQFENCQNGVDDDGDGATDCQDLACAQQPFCLPEGNCADGVDNDQDNVIDCNDVDCADDGPCLPETVCDDGLDSDLDNLIDCADPDCALACSEDCSDGEDNDQDNLVDCQDPSCANDPICSGGAIGDACTSDPECAGDVCLEEAVDGFPSGYCSQNCDLAVGVCDAPGDGLCIDVGLPTGLCLDACLVASPDCSAGYSCVDVSGGLGQGVCFPACTNNNQCPTTNICNPDDGFCAQFLEDCDNNADDDEDGLVDCADAGCLQDPGCADFEDCFDGIDNDADGAVDCVDSSCAVSCANACLSPINPTLPTVQNSTNTGHANVADGSCQLNPISGPPGGGGGDVVYRVVSNVAGLLDLSLTSATADLGLFVHTVCGNSVTETGCSDIFLAGGTETLQVPITPGQPLFVFVGGFSAPDQGQYTLNMEILPGATPEQCNDGQDNDLDGTIDCQDANCAANCANACADPDGLFQSTSGSTTGHSNTSDGTCQLFPVAGPPGGGGPDVVYRAVTATAGVLTLTLFSDVDLGLFVQTTCGDINTEIGCADDFFGPGSTETLSGTLPANQELFIFVGGFDASQSGPYILQVN